MVRGLVKDSLSFPKVIYLLENCKYWVFFVVFSVLHCCVCGMMSLHIRKISWRPEEDILMSYSMTFSRHLETSALNEQEAHISFRLIQGFCVSAVLPSAVLCSDLLYSDPLCYAMLRYAILCYALLIWGL